MEGCEEVCSRLEVSRCDSSEVLEAVEEAFDSIAFPVEFPIDGADDTHVALAWDVGGRTRGFDSRDHRLAEVAAVADDISGKAEWSDEVGRGGLVGGLPAGQHQSDRQAPPVHDGMNLRRQSPTRETDGVIRAPFFPPAACWWARTMELSIRCRACGDASAKASKMRSQTPAFAHLL